MKKKLLLIPLLLAYILLLCSCSNGKAMKPDTPINTGLLLNHAISSEDYESFNDLFSKGRKNHVSKEEFQALTEISKTSTGGSGCTLFEVITLDNGKMFLVRLTPTNMDGKYEVEDVIPMPEDLTEFFLGETLN